MKTKILFILMVCTVFLATAGIACAQSRTNQLIRRCPASNTNATVSIDARGNVVLTPCATRTVSFGGSVATVPAANGTAAAPSISFTNSPTTGFFRPAADTIGVSTAGTERFTFGPTGSLAFKQGPLTTTAVPYINHTAEWNDGGTTHAGIFSNVTDTASAAGSLLVDLQVGGASKFKVDKAGVMTVASCVGCGVTTSGATPTGSFAFFSSATNIVKSPFTFAAGIYSMMDSGGNANFYLTHKPSAVSAGEFFVGDSALAGPYVQLTEETNTLALNATTLTLNGAVQPKVYRALVSQTGTGAPIATVLVNTLGGTVVWARSDTGQYTVTLNGAFPSGKTFVMLNRTTVSYQFSAIRASNDVINVTTAIAGAPADSGLNTAAFEILVYP